MAANITFTSQDAALGPFSAGGKLRERVKAVGSSSAANDTGTCVFTHLARNVRPVGGAFAVTAETVGRGKGASCTIEANFALGSDTTYAEFEGDGV